MNSGAGEVLTVEPEAATESIDHGGPAIRPSSSDCFRLLIEGVKDYAILMLDPHGRIISWNTGTESVYGYTAAEIIGQPFTAFYPLAEIAELTPATLLKMAALEGLVEEEGWRRRKDGSHFWAHIITRSLLEHGRLMGFAQVTHDLSEQKRAEQILVEHKALERSNRELEQFAYVASHDLQEPLRKIQAFGDRLKTKCGDALPPEAHDYLERMLKSADRMQRLINDLLTFSRLTIKGKKFLPVNLNEVVGDVLADLESRLDHDGGRVEVRELPTFDADPLQMRQLLQNLLSNALKFHRPGVPPQVKVYSKVFTRSRFGGTLGGGIELCEIYIEDNGIGFDEKYLARIFTVFQRLHGRDQYEGTGIGLAVCRRIVEWHGGSITARSVPNQGSTFIVTLPLRQTSKPHHE